MARDAVLPDPVVAPASFLASSIRVLRGTIRASEISCRGIATGPVEAGFQTRGENVPSGSPGGEKSGSSRSSSATQAVVRSRVAPDTQKETGADEGWGTWLGLESNRGGSSASTSRYQGPRCESMLCEGFRRSRLPQFKIRREGRRPT